MVDPVDEGQQKVEAEPVIVDGKHPETVSWNQYVGIKESLGGKLEKATQKVTDLEEQVKKAVSTEEHGRIAQELEETKTKFQAISDELKTTKEATLSEKRATLTQRGISAEDVKTMSEEQINGAIKVLATYKPKPDMGGGGGGEPPARGIDKIHRGFDSLHPSH